MTPDDLPDCPQKTFYQVLSPRRCGYPRLAGPLPSRPDRGGHPDGGRWYTLDIDDDKVAKRLDDAGFRGWVSLEFEGKEDPVSGCAKSMELLRDAFA